MQLYDCSNLYISVVEMQLYSLCVFFNISSWISTLCLSNYHSYRLPQKIIDYTKKMMEGTPWISEMQPHASVTEKSGEGSVERITGWDELASKLPDDLGKVFVLVRTRKQLEKVSQELIKQEILHQVIGVETVFDTGISKYPCKSKVYTHRIIR